VYQVRSNPPGNEVILLKAVVYPFWIECAAAIVRVFRNQRASRKGYEYLMGLTNALQERASSVGTGERANDQK
jgi:hypothetical protein